MKKTLATITLVSWFGGSAGSACTFEIIHKATLGSEAVPITNLYLEDDDEGAGRTVAKKLMPGSSTGTLVRHGVCGPFKLEWHRNGKSYAGTFTPQPDQTGVMVITIQTNP